MQALWGAPTFGSPTPPPLFEYTPPPSPAACLPAPAPQHPPTVGWRAAEWPRTLLTGTLQVLAKRAVSLPLAYFLQGKYDHWMFCVFWKRWVWWMRRRRAFCEFVIFYLTKTNERRVPAVPPALCRAHVRACVRIRRATHRLHTCAWEVGSSTPGGGGVDRAPPKTGGRGFGKRAQLTGPLISYYEFWH